MSNQWGNSHGAEMMHQGRHLEAVPDLRPAPTNEEVGVFNFIERLEWLKSTSIFRYEPELLQQERVKNGYLQRFGFVTELGYTYDAVIGMPLDAVTDIPIIETSAWITSSRGHNEHTLRSFVEAGSPFIFVGPEGSFRPNYRDYPVPREGISLAGSAAAVLNFTKEISLQYPHLMNPTKRKLIGESRGAMTAMGMLALDDIFDQEIIFADVTAPCFPRQVEPGDILKLSGHLLSEPRSLWRLASRLGLSRLIHYPSTIDPHPYSLAHQIGIGPALFSGEAGDLARLIPNDKIIHITCFNDDFASMPKVWQEIFSNHPNVKITLLDGSHLTIADPETLQYIHARSKALNEQLESGIDTMIDGQLVFNRAHELIPK